MPKHIARNDPAQGRANLIRGRFPNCPIKHWTPNTVAHRPTKASTSIAPPILLGSDGTCAIIARRLPAGRPSRVVREARIAAKARELAAEFGFNFESMSVFEHVRLEGVSDDALG
jgi:hypothetical protein